MIDREQSDDDDDDNMPSFISGKINIIL